MHRRRADEPRDSGETLDACEVALDRRSYEVVPADAGARVNEHRVAVVLVLDTCDRDLDDEAGPATVANDEVRSTTEDEDALTGAVCLRQCEPQLRYRRHANEASRDAADAECRARRERDIALDRDRHAPA
jgi:hypothetical protein